MYNHAPPDYVCPFCLIARGKTHPVVFSDARDVIYQDARITALVASHQWPNNPGNVLIFPNAHHENIYDLPVEYAGPIHACAQRIALAMKAVWSCDGVSTRQHNEPAGSQDVWHYHLHVTPRTAGDNLYATLATDRALMPPERRAALAADLRGALAGWSVPDGNA